VDLLSNFHARSGRARMVMNDACCALKKFFLRGMGLREKFKKPLN
jgi:hypothetical protein